MEQRLARRKVSLCFHAGMEDAMEAQENSMGDISIVIYRSHPRIPEDRREVRH